MCTPNGIFISNGVRNASLLILQPSYFKVVEYINKPATWPGNCDATYIDITAPIDKPPTNTCSWRCFTATNVLRTPSYQSCQPVACRSLLSPQCPARVGTYTVQLPTLAKPWATRRSSVGVPVRPWINRIPTGPLPRTKPASPSPRSISCKFTVWSPAQAVARAVSGPCRFPGS